ncbi:MAG: hypothetical protein R3D70_04705 [Rhizobiaceae bacterium]
MNNTLIVAVSNTAFFCKIVDARAVRELRFRVPVSVQPFLARQQPVHSALIIIVPIFGAAVHAL